MSTRLYAQGQPIAVGFNRARNIDKAAYVLKGIIDGVNIDGNLADSEILYLDAWMRSQKHLDLQAVAFDLFKAVDHVLEDQIITHDERADLQQLIQAILKFGDDVKTSDDESRINEFLNLLKSICADGIINRTEIRRVEEWIAANIELSNAFPIKPVYTRIREAVRHDVIDGEELANLSKLVAEIAGDSLANSGDIDGSIGQVFCDDINHLSFEEKTFCFTGKFLGGTRKQCQREAEVRGAYVKSSVTADVDVLVIGSVTSQDWRNRNFGRKIERAMDLRTSVGAPAIISENQWTTFLSNSKQPSAEPIAVLY